MGSFEGVADVYRRSRHNYPTELRDHLIDIGALEPRSTVLDLGAGTGQLALMASEIARSVIAVDPEPDMVRVGREATDHVDNIQWVTGSDRDLRRIVKPPIDLVLIGSAFHLMNQAALLHDLDSLVTENGSVVICSPSIPVWLQDNDWSRSLCEALSESLGRQVGRGGVPDHESDVEVLRGSAFSFIETWTNERVQTRNPKSVLGELASATSDSLAWKALHAAVDSYLDNGALNELVRTTAVVARRADPQ